MELSLWCKVWRRGGGSGVQLWLLLAGCLTSQLHTMVSQGWICWDQCSCCHTGTEAVDQTSCLAQSQCTDTWPTRPSTVPIAPDAWQGSHKRTNVQVAGVTGPGKIPTETAGFDPGSSTMEADSLTTRPSRGRSLGALTQLWYKQTNTQTN